VINTAHLPTAAQMPNERPTLVDQLTRKADVNHDGTVTSAEFTAFLGGLMQELDRERPTGERPQATRPVEPAAAEPVPHVTATPRPASAVEALQKAIARTGGDR
jgi:hypothetical protein